MAQIELRRLVLEPDRPIASWRENLGIEARDWNDTHDTLFNVPESWESELSEVWYEIVKPGRQIWSLEVSNIFFGLNPPLHGFTPRMNFALAKAEPELVRQAIMPAIGAACQDSGGSLGVSCLVVRGGRLCADVVWDDGDRWCADCVFAGFRLRTSIWAPL